MLPLSTVLLTLLAPAQARPPCLTPYLHPFGRDTGRAGAADRPDSVGYLDSELYPIRVHYRNEDDAERAETVILPAAEYAWSVEVDEMGWPAPPSDNGLGGSDAIDYYLTNEDTYGGAWTWGPYSDAIEDDDYFSIASFIALDDNERLLTDELMPTFIVHEFNHVLQYGIDGAEATSFVWESTAEAMEELTLPDSNLYWIDVSEFQSLPFASLLFDGYSREITEYNEYSLYEYGGAISGLFLEQAYGSFDGTTLLQLWLNMAQPDSSNEPDYVDALGMIGGDTDPTVGDVYLRLAEWRMFADTYDDGAHYAEASEWGRGARVATEDKLKLSEIDGTSVSPVDEPYDLGTSYWEIEVDGDTSAPLRLSLVGEGEVSWGIVAAAWLDGEPARVVRTRGADGEGVETELDLTGATRVMVGVANLGKENLNAEGTHKRLGFTLTFGDPVVDSGGDDTATGDSGGVDSGGEEGGEEGGGEVGGGEEGGEEGGAGGQDTGKTEEPGRCGCSAADTAPRSAMGLVGLALGATLLGRRRR